MFARATAHIIKSVNRPIRLDYSSSHGAVRSGRSGGDVNDEDIALMAVLIGHGESECIQGKNSWVRG